MEYLRYQGFGGVAHTPTQQEILYEPHVWRTGEQAEDT